MVMKIAFSGPQGSGKSTLINALREVNTNHCFVFDDTKVSRKVQTELGIKELSETTKDFKTMELFQYTIFKSKVSALLDVCSKEPHNENSIIITDRSFSDIVAYYQLWCEKLERNADLPSWAVYAEGMQRGSLIDHVIYVPFMNHVVWENDPNRADKADIQRFDELLLESMHRSMGSNTIHTIQSLNVSDRVQEVLDIIERISSNVN